MNYSFFADRRAKQPAMRLNRRVYSCILLTNTLPEYRWRGRYNEDTDLSIRFLKAGYCTALFNHYLCMKVGTMRMKGGNTEELYLLPDGTDGRQLMAESLVEQHPDIARVSWKWGRPQHHVNYEPFRNNKLIPLEEGAAPVTPTPPVITVSETAVYELVEDGEDTEEEEEENPIAPIVTEADLCCPRCTAPIEGPNIGPCPECQAALQQWTEETAAVSAERAEQMAADAELQLSDELDQRQRLQIIYDNARKQSRVATEDEPMMDTLW